MFARIVVILRGRFLLPPQEPFERFLLVTLHTILLQPLLWTPFATNPEIQHGIQHRRKEKGGRGETERSQCLGRLKDVTALATQSLDLCSHKRVVLSLVH